MIYEVGPYRIITFNENPPIPIRTFDWCAREADADERGLQGWGATPLLAVVDLLNQLWDRDELPEEVPPKGQGSPPANRDEEKVPGQREMTWWCCTADFGEHDPVCKFYKGPTGISEPQANGGAVGVSPDHSAPRRCTPKGVTCHDDGGEAGGGA
jgi:hypothetical protein